MALTASTFFARPATAIGKTAEADFFTALRVGNNTFKKTSAGRFGELDAALTRALGSSPITGEALDIGISSGATTLELDSALKAAGHRLRLTGTDLALRAHIVPIGPGCRVLVDPGGHPLQYDILGWAVRPWRRRLDFFDGMIAVRGLLARLGAPRARRALAANHVLRSVDLISPHLARRRDIAVVEDDVTRCNPDLQGRFAVVRVANILNRDYFDEVTLCGALDNVASYLAGPGALLLIVRTLGRDGHNGTLFTVDASGERLRAIERYGAGSEIETLVLATIRRVPGAD